jgi:glycosyltransferase involved in cell wall biosynthesis
VKVLLINQYFHPDIAATAQLLGDLASWLGANGWEVAALAGRGRYASAPGEARVALRQPWNGVTVHRLWSTNFGRARAAGRICDSVTFLISAAFAVTLRRRADAVVCLSTPPFVALLGLIAQLKGSRLICKVEDLYPHVAVALSAMRGDSLTARGLGRLSAAILRRADLVITLDEAMTEKVRSAGCRSVEVIPNWADEAAIRPDPAAGRAFRNAHGLGERFVVLYSGNLGLAHRFDAVAEAAAICATAAPPVLFLFVGNGARLREVKQETAGLHNVRFMEYRPRNELNRLYNAADLHLVTLRDEVSGLLFPSKYPAALAAGKPVLVVGGRGAPLEREIREQNLGWTCAHDAAAVFQAVRDAFDNPGKHPAMARNARAVFEARYSRGAAMQRWGRALNSALAARPPEAVNSQPGNA